MVCSAVGQLQPALPVTLTLTSCDYPLSERKFRLHFSSGVWWASPAGCCLLMKFYFEGSLLVLTLNTVIYSKKKKKKITSPLQSH